MNILETKDGDIAHDN